MIRRDVGLELIVSTVKLFTNKYGALDQGQKTPEITHKQTQNTKAHQRSTDLCFSNPNSKSDNFKIQILFKSNSLSLLLGYM